MTLLPFKRPTEFHPEDPFNLGYNNTFYGVLALVVVILIGCIS